MKKQLPTHTIMNELKSGSVFFSRKHAQPQFKQVEREDATGGQTNAQEVTREVTPQSTQNVAPARDRSRDNSREKPRGLPTRDEVQEFSFRLRDELKVKVQAEVPHHWQDELEAIARALNVKKLELYRFIIGEFLGKVRREKQPSQA